MNKIVGYFHQKPTWRAVTVKEYKKIFNHDIAISYLKHEIFESVEREMAQILSGSFAGFYAGLRFLFAEVTYLSHLYWGKKGENWKRKESAYVVRYMRKFKILYPECGVYYEVFRHGLMHTHHPKWIKKARRVAGWYISNTDKSKTFGIFIPEFTNQVKSAIKQFIEELEIEKNRNKRNRLDKFFEALTDAGKILTKNDLKPYARTDYPKVRL